MFLQKRPRQAFLQDVSRPKSAARCSITKEGYEVSRNKCQRQLRHRADGDLIIRDMLHGKRTYGELLDSPERIPTNILADRLRRIERAGIISRSAYHERPVRYAYLLREKGRDLAEVLLALVRWGKRHIRGTRTLTESAPGLGQKGSTRGPTRAKPTDAG